MKIRCEFSDFKITEKKDSGVGALSFHRLMVCFLCFLSIFTNLMVNFSVCACSDLQAREEVEEVVP